MCPAFRRVAFALFRMRRLGWGGPRSSCPAPRGTPPRTGRLVEKGKQLGSRFSYGARPEGAGEPALKATSEQRFARARRVGPEGFCPPAAVLRRRHPGFLASCDCRLTGRQG